ncbi:MAG TPA: prepilin peptidase [Candidatus Saccharimonadales bacterium]|nr:prepilin peptidase [Candidatus Saccharimonadales bacterium]
MMIPMEAVLYIVLIVVGAAMGSFAGAMTWRLRAKQLVYDKKAGTKLDEHEAAEYKRLLPLTKKHGRHDRSIDLDTGKRLAWYDLIPIFSWLWLRGKSRYSGKPIGMLEILIEVGMAAFFVLSYLSWPYPLETSVEVARLVLWLAAGVGLGILFAYDIKWFLLPDRINFTVIGLGVVSALIVVLGAQNVQETVFSIIGAVLILSGLYWALYIVSKHRWVGFGDVKLGLGLALLLADWRLAFLALFLANLVGCLVVLPGMITGKLKRNSHVPFGPLLIIGFVIAGLVGNRIVDFYFSSLL